MKDSAEKEEFIERFLDQASQRWGGLEVEDLKTSLERTAEAVWKIRRLALDPYEEPGH